MTRRIRVFVSSTMNDLPNERAAVIQKLHSYNIEPVNAENSSPTGDTSWGLLSREIRESDIMILLLGERYGWIPDRGPHGHEGLSVTELEYREARAAGIPVLPFFKQLRYGSDSTSPDAVARDRFRAVVEDWDGGQFRRSFDLASDLADAVGEALAAVLAQRFLQHRPMPLPTAPTLAAGSHEQLSTTLAGRPTIFAGAGISLAAGLPSASLMMDAMVGAIREVDREYVPTLSGTAFNSVATDLQIARGRAEIEEIARALVSPAASAEGSQFHRLALAASDLVVTTNYDNLFESVIDERRVIARDLELGEDLPRQCLVKLHGTIDDPETLVLTEHDLFGFMTERTELSTALARRLAAEPVLVIGSSLRDPSVLALFERAGPVEGLYVSPSIAQSERRRLATLGLQPVEVDWSDILATFRAVVQTER